MFSWWGVVETISICKWGIAVSSWYRISQKWGQRTFSCRDKHLTTIIIEQLFTILLDYSVIVSLFVPYLMMLLTFKGNVVTNGVQISLEQSGGTGWSSVCTTNWLKLHHWTPFQRFQWSNVQHEIRSWCRFLVGLQIYTP